MTLLALAAALVLAGGGLGAAADPAGAAFPGHNGRIAFASKLVTAGNPEGDYEIFTMNPDGSGVKQLTVNAAFDGDPAWSPSGRTIAFVSFRDGNFEIYTMSASGRNPTIGRKPTNRSNNGASDSQPAWSPDGKKLVFRSSRDGNAEVYTMAADGGSQTNRSNNAVSDDQPDWQGVNVASQG